MKFLVILLIALSGYANAQTKTTDLTQGKYLENTSKDNFVGTWFGNNNELQLNVTIKAEKRHFKRGNADMYLDFLIVKVNRFIVKGSDLQNYFKTGISLVSTNNGNFFSGVYDDPITKNSVNLILRIISGNKLMLTSSLPEIDPGNRTEKRSVMPKQIELIKQVR